jgi:hypothetical protein
MYSRGKNFYASFFFLWLYFIFSTFQVFKVPCFDLCEYYVCIYVDSVCMWLCFFFYTFFMIGVWEVDKQIKTKNQLRGP